MRGKLKYFYKLMPLFSSSNKKKLRFIVEKKTPGLISRH